jgi:hypothetical protein
MKAGNGCLSHIPMLRFPFLFLIVHPKLTKPHKIVTTILVKNKPKIWNAYQGEIGDSVIQTCEGLKLKGGEAWCATTRTMDSKPVPQEYGNRWQLPCAGQANCLLLDNSGKQYVGCIECHPDHTLADDIMWRERCDPQSILTFFFCCALTPWTPWAPTNSSPSLSSSLSSSDVPSKI